MSEREKALEAALRECRTDLMIAAGNADDAARTEPRWDGVGEKLRVRVREADAALAMPATVDRASWEAGRDAAADYVQEMAPSYKEYDSGRDALNDAVDAIRNLTPPEDAL
jgi:hypothetical protein